VSSLRRAAASATELVCRVMGGRRVVRAARFVYRRARLDVPIDPAAEGEMQLHSWIGDEVLAMSSPGEAHAMAAINGRPEQLVKDEG
jgi:hypothetical protein